MQSIWNDFEIKKPPFITLPSNHSQFVLNLHETIDTFFRKHGKHKEEFNETAALLSRLMARRKNSFRKMKGFKDICKLNAALCRLLRLDFKRDLENFRSTLPDVAYEEGTSVQLPTRDSFDFLLIRLIALYELHKRINDCCTSAAEYFTIQLRLCYFFEISTLLLAVIAKIYNLSTKFANAAADLFNNSLQYRTKLPFNSKSKFLKEDQLNLPEKLEIIKLPPLEYKEDLVSKEQLPKTLIQEQKLSAVKAQNLKKIDVGKQIERTSKQTQKLFDIEQLNSVEQIERFIVKETKSRTKNLNGAITKQILSHEWAGATKLFERKVQKGETKKAVNVFRKFLSLKIL